MMTDRAEVAREIAPRGVLRVALNHGNAVLVERGDDEADPRGVSVELALELAKRLRLDHEFVHYERAGQVSATVDRDVWDLCFLAIDPLRAESIAFSPPYVAIEGCYVLQSASGARTAADVDTLKLRIGIVNGSAYALHLTRMAGGAELVPFESAADAVKALETRRLDGMAGVRQAMQRIAASSSALRLIEEPFMTILQAMGVPAGRPLAAAGVTQFVEEMKSSGFVAEALARSGHADVTVP